MVVSLLSFWIIVPFPEHAAFLTNEEKRLLLARLHMDGGGVLDDRISFGRILPMLADWKIWIWYEALCCV